MQASPRPAALHVRRRQGIHDPLRPRQQPTILNCMVQVDDNDPVVTGKDEADALASLRGDSSVEVRPGRRVVDRSKPAVHPQRNLSRGVPHPPGARRQLSRNPGRLLGGHTLTVGRSVRPVGTLPTRRAAEPGVSPGHQRHRAGAGLAVSAARGHGHGLSLAHQCHDYRRLTCTDVIDTTQRTRGAKRLVTRCRRSEALGTRTRGQVLYGPDTGEVAGRGPPPPGSGDEAELATRSDGCSQHAPT